MAKDMNFKFVTRAPRESPDKTMKTIFKMGAWSGSLNPVNFWALSAANANSSKMATKYTDFKFGVYASGKVPRRPLNFFFEKRSRQGHVTA